MSLHLQTIYSLNYFTLQEFPSMHDDCWEIVVNHKLNKLLRVNYLKSKLIKNHSNFYNKNFYLMWNVSTLKYVWYDVGYKPPKWVLRAYEDHVMPECVILGDCDYILENLLYLHQAV